MGVEGKSSQLTTTHFTRFSPPLLLPPVAAARVGAEPPPTCDLMAAT